jgi:SAM-dependent methyltransferase
MVDGAFTTGAVWGSRERPSRDRFAAYAGAKVRRLARAMGVSKPWDSRPVSAYFERPLRRAEHPGTGTVPIWAAENYDPDHLVGISERFLGKADVYTETYTDSKGILRLLRRAIALQGIPVDQFETALDFGSGPGTNTVFPLHAIQPSLRIVATDISLPLLATLSRLLDEHPQKDLVDIVAWDCTSGGVRSGAFDLVTGASLLHHLIDPRCALRTACKALRPGGYAIFFDPFDGAGIVLGLYQLLLSSNLTRNERLSDVTVRTLEALSEDYQARFKGTAPEDFVDLEDKWIFSPEWMVREGLEAGFSSVVVRGNQDHLGMYGDYVKTQLRMSVGQEAAEMPGWAHELMAGFDRSLTDDVRRRMMLEATIVMRK